MRCLVLLFAVAGCDSLFSVDHVKAVDLSAGCADGEREGFVDTPSYPAIAACSGAWDVPGVAPVAAAMCGRLAGDDGMNVLGEGCNVEDLCADGWHVCRDRLEVYARSPDHTCDNITTEANAFFLTRQSGPSGGNCNTSGTNDVFGCGTTTIDAVAATCAPLTKSSDNDCFSLRPFGWVCTQANGGEATNIYKSDPLMPGGVLCCRD